jgi:cell division protein ZapB
MESELKSLEEKIDQFVNLCHQLRLENIQLRQDLAGAVSENKRLAEKIAAATTRLEAILMQIPEREE